MSSFCFAFIRLYSHFVYTVTSFIQSIRLYSHFVYTVTSFILSLRLYRCCKRVCIRITSKSVQNIGLYTVTPCALIVILRHINRTICFSRWRHWRHRYCRVHSAIITVTITLNRCQIHLLVKDLCSTLVR